MAAIPGFRAALWTKLGALCLQAAGYFENKRRQAAPFTYSVEQDQAETEASVAPGRIKGAPPHWLAMVRDRAPGFLYRLEAVSYPHPPVTGENSSVTQGAGTADHQPAAAAQAYSTLEPDIRFQKRSEPGVTRPLEKSARIAFSAEADHDDGTKNRLRFKTSEIGQSGPASGRAQQTRSFDPSVPAIDSSEAGRTRLNFKRERPSAVFNSLHQAAAAAPPVTEIGSIPNLTKTGAAEKTVSSKQVPVTGKSSEIRGEPTGQSSLKPGLNPSWFHHDQRPVLVRSSDADAGVDRVDRSDAGQTAVIQNPAQTRDRPEQARQSTAGGDSILADSFWPDLSGLEKTPVNRERWPELPDDVWNDFWRQQEVAANIKPEQADAHTTGALWNG